MQPSNQSSYSVVLLDIEGTTTPVDFVYKTLFPFARNHVETFLRQHSTSEEVRAISAQLREENAEDLHKGLPATVIPPGEDDIQTVVAYVHWLIEIDRKSTPLKSLQGMIWEEGYRSGELQSEIFADVPRAFQKWLEQGTAICIFSSGSVLAQKLLFAHTEAGDLTPLIDDYFDTHIGGKKEVESYTRIARELGKSPAEILFASDITAELAAAVAAGLQTRLCLRPGNAPPEEAADYQTIHSFDEVLL